MKTNWIDSVSLRAMREEDLPLIEWDGEYARYRRIYREVFRNARLGASFPLIAETAADGIIGQVFLNEKGPDPALSPGVKYGFLTSFRVKAAFRGRGVGTKLFRACEEKGQSLGMREFYLNCEVDNAAAMAFYDSLGFRKFRRNRGDWTYINDQGRVTSESNESWCLVYQLPSSEIPLVPLS